MIEILIAGIFAFGAHSIWAQITINRLHKENDELQNTFNLQFNAQIRAVEMWQKETGSKGVWPDHTNLLMYLMDMNETYRQDLVRLEETIKYLNNTTKQQSEFIAIHNASEWHKWYKIHYEG